MICINWKETEKKDLLTSTDENNIISFAAGRFYLWVNCNLCESVTENGKWENIILCWWNVTGVLTIWQKSFGQLTLCLSGRESVVQRMPAHFRPSANVSWWNSTLHRAAFLSHCDTNRDADREANWDENSIDHHLFNLWECLIKGKYLLVHCSRATSLSWVHFALWSFPRMYQRYPEVNEITSVFNKKNIMEWHCR